MQDKINKRHPHADLIHAWAEGEEIEYFNSIHGIWKLLKTPNWCEDDKYRIKPKESKWYENIPEHGILCWVERTKNLKANISIITGYDPDIVASFLDHYGDTWIYATPLTNDEIKQFLRD